MLDYFGEDIAQFYNKAEGRLADYGDSLLAVYDRQGIEGLTDTCLTAEIVTLSEILEAVNLNEAEAESLISYALSVYELDRLPSSPFREITYTITGGNAAPKGLIYDEDVLVSIEGITERYGELPAGNYIGNLERLLNLMLKRYKAPAINSFRHNKATVLEVGQSISETVVFNWNVTDAGNVADAADSGSLTTSIPNVITPAGPFNLKDTFSRTVNLVTPFIKTTVGTLYFYLNGKDTRGNVIPQVSSSIHWNTRIMAGNATTATVTKEQIEAFTPIPASARQVTGTIIGAGYKYIFIPDLLDQNGIGFKDPVNGNVDIDMLAGQGMAIVNPYGLDLPGRLYRTKNSLGSDLTFNIV
jgi:hypothetical protein